MIHSTPSIRVAFVLLLAVLGGACRESAYKLINVPHCAVAAGAPRSGFAEQLRWVYTSGGARGTGPLSGEWPTLGLGASDTAGRELLLAVVACPRTPQSNITTSMSDPPNPADGLTADKVPQLCPGQTVLFHGTLTATDDAVAREQGYDGVLKFPDVAVTCPAGTLARTTSADIAPRPK